MRWVSLLPPFDEERKLRIKAINQHTSGHRASKWKGQGREPKHRTPPSIVAGLAWLPMARGGSLSWFPIWRRPAPCLGPPCILCHQSALGGPLCSEPLHCALSSWEALCYSRPGLGQAVFILSCSGKGGSRAKPGCLHLFYFGFAVIVGVAFIFNLTR